MLRVQSSYPPSTKKLDNICEVSYSTDESHAKISGKHTRVKSRSKNTAFGPIAAHVYDEPGTYTITLRVLDQSGNYVSDRGDGATFQVTVTPPDTVFAGTLTTCVNPAGDSSESHVTRIWQAYRSVIAHNNFSGASTNTSAGRHALKFHSPADTGSREVSHCTPAAGNGCLENISRFVVISDNIFGSSGPWQVAIGPQDSIHDEKITDLLFERNRLIADYGTPSNQGSNPVQIALETSAGYSTFRNNIIDLTGAYHGATGIYIWRRGIEPAPHHNRVYNNTIFRGDASNQDHIGVGLTADAGGRALSISERLNTRQAASILCLPQARRGWW